VKEACAMNLLRDVEERPRYVAPNDMVKSKDQKRIAKINILKK